MWRLSNPRSRCCLVWFLINVLSISSYLEDGHHHGSIGDRGESKRTSFSLPLHTWALTSLSWLHLIQISSYKPHLQMLPLWKLRLQHKHLSGPSKGSVHNKVMMKNQQWNSKVKLQSEWTITNICRTFHPIAAEFLSTTRSTMSRMVHLASHTASLKKF